MERQGARYVWHLPCPMELLIDPKEAMAGVVDDQEMTRTIVFEERPNAQSQLSICVGATRDVPPLGVVVVKVMEESLQMCQFILDSQIFILPAQ